MDYQTAAAIGQNLSGVANAFLRMTDPEVRAKAQLIGLQREGLMLENRGRGIENQYRPGLFQAQTNSYNANATQSLAAAGNQNAQADVNRVRGQAGHALLYGTIPSAPSSPAGEPALPVGGFDAPLPNIPTQAVPNGTYQVTDPATGGKVTVDQNGVPVDDNPSAGVLPSYPAQDLNRQATLSNIFGGGGAADLMTGQGKAAALSANSEIGMRRALGAQGQVMGQGEYFDPAASNAFQGRALQNNLDQEVLRQQGAMDRDLIKGAFPGAAGGGTFKNPLATMGNLEDLNKLVGSKFGMPDEAGNAVVPPEMQAAANSWKTTFSSLVGAGVPAGQAEVIADQHHNIGGSLTTEDPWFGSPRKAIGDGFRAQPMLPEQAAQYAPANSMTAAAGFSNPLEMLMALREGGRPAPAPAVAPPAAKPAQAPAQTPQTGVRMGDKQSKEEKQKGMDRGTDWNAATLGNALRAAQIAGVPLDDLAATALAGTPQNDNAIAQVFSRGATGKNGGTVRGGSTQPQALRNAFLDARALQRANIDPALIQRIQSGGQAVSPADINSLVDTYRTK